MWTKARVAGVGVVLLVSLGKTLPEDTHAGDVRHSLLNNLESEVHHATLAFRAVQTKRQARPVKVGLERPQADVQPNNPNKGDGVEKTGRANAEHMTRDSVTATAGPS